MSGEALHASRIGRERFERHYEASADPWGYRTSSYERDKYGATLAALPPRPLAHVLEVGCSIGVFTRLLAERCEQLVAVDFSARAIELAREQLHDLANVELARASFPEQTPPAAWDLVVCSEVLYYLDRKTFAEAIEWLRARLEQGACVLAVSWRGEGVEEPISGDEAHDALARELGRWHVLDARRDHYRLDRFDGAYGGGVSDGHVGDDRA
ncbi:MAG TPA: SAM-dependent methyltransferase [Solirubrobacteraceae bacterium]|jgi:SAM-dependent methyltransferase|nr:SAM-dependent methyltransferase [Solirubrobacteraceae bacterium]